MKYHGNFPKYAISISKNEELSIKSLMMYRGIFPKYAISISKKAKVESIFFRKLQQNLCNKPFVKRALV